MNVEAEGLEHYTIIFNSFVFYQVFNEFNSRSIFNDVNVFRGIHKNPIFVGVVVLTVSMQAFLVQVGGSFVQTAPLNGTQWITTILLGAIALPVGFVMRFIPVTEDPESFASMETQNEPNLTEAAEMNEKLLDSNRKGLHSYRESLL
jgi:hypothetical protein